MPTQGDDHSVSGPRAFIFGLDGATLDLVEPWGKLGYLPNLWGLAQRGAYGKLRSTYPATTPLAWPAVYTGTDPSKHGIFGFQMRREGTYTWDKSSTADLARPTLWDIAGHAGLRCGVFFVPYTFPARPLAGSLVAGRGSPRKLDSRLSQPPALAREMAERFGEKALFGPRRTRTQTLDEIADALIESIDAQTEAVRWAIGRADLDVVFTVWDHTDTAIHLFWHYSQPLPPTDSPLFRVYEAVDRGIGSLLADVTGDPLIIVCSDHGAQPVKNKLHLPVWLSQNGYLAIKESRRKGLRRALRIWRKLPHFLKRRVPAATRQRVIDRSLDMSSGGLIDWDRTMLYPQPVTAEAIYINLEGREPRGSVPVGEADELLDRVADDLRAIRSPEGEPVVTNCLKGRDLYRGPRSAKAPDLVLETAPGAMVAHVGVDRDVVLSRPEPPRPGDRPNPIGYHHPDGLVIINGPGVKRAGQIGGRVEDITPTLLRALDVPIPDDLDGRAIEEAFEELPAPRFLKLEDIVVPEATDGLTAEEADDVDKHLRELGYIE